MSRMTKEDVFQFLSLVCVLGNAYHKSYSEALYLLVVVVSIEIARRMDW